MEKSEILRLIDKAIEARETAYAKYSGFKVGAVVVGDNGKEYVGSNIENQSYGLSICAERNAITTAVTDGMKKIKVVVIMADQENPVPPCGSCRQVMSEFADKDTQIIMSNLKKDYKIAVDWYCKAAGDGNGDAMFNLGLMCKKGRGITKDYKQAIQWWRKAAKLEQKNAQKELTKLGEKW